MKESKYSEKVVNLLKEAGAVVNVNTASVFERVGRADVEACYRGHYLALELKTGNYQPDPLQIKYLQDIRNSGGIGLILRDEEGIILIKRVIESLNNDVKPVFKPLPKIKESVGEIEYD